MDDGLIIAIAAGSASCVCCFGMVIAVICAPLPEELKQRKGKTEANITEKTDIRELPLPVINILKTAFELYDLDASGDLNSPTELRQISVHMLFNHPQYVRYDHSEVNKVYDLCDRKRVSNKRPLNLKQWIAWFQIELASPVEQMLVEIRKDQALYGHHTTEIGVHAPVVPNDECTPAEPEVMAPAPAEPEVVEVVVEPEEEGFPVAKLESILRQYMQRYDIDGSGSLNSVEELRMIVVNLVFNHPEWMGSYAKDVKKCTEALNTICHEQDISDEHSWDFPKLLFWVQHLPKTIAS